MSKRIEDLIELAYEKGYAASAQMRDGLDVVAVQRLAQAVRAKNEALNAARDALEADLAELIDRAQGLADKARQYSGCDLFDQADALDAAVTRLLNGGEG